MADAPLAVQLLVFDDVEVLDACGPFEVLSVASRVAARRGLPAPFSVALVAAGPTRTVVARGGLRLVADHLVEEVLAGTAGLPPADVLVVPGGVTDAVEADVGVREWLQRSAPRAQVTASVCTGAFVLAAAGLLDGLTATTHWQDQDALAAAYPAVAVVRDQRWVDHGRVATSAGVSAGIDLALHLVARTAGEGLARATARQMDYPWQADPRLPLTA